MRGSQQHWALRKFICDECISEMRAIWVANQRINLPPLWMSGVPLCEIEKVFLERTTNLKQCKNARHFALRLVPDLAFLAGIPGRLLAARLCAHV